MAGPARARRSESRHGSSMCRPVRRGERRVGSGGNNWARRGATRLLAPCAKCGFAAGRGRSSPPPISTVFIAIFNGLLVYVTYNLVMTTSKLWKASTEQIRLTQQSIDLARDEFSSTHRPKIRIKHIWLTSEIWEGEPIAVDLVCVNYGTVAAVLHEIGIKFHVIDIAKVIPIAREIKALIRPQNLRIEFGLNSRFEGITDGTVITPDQKRSIQIETSKLYCFGYVSYFDAAGMRITGFCRVLTFPQNIPINKSISNCRFRVFYDPDFEYED